MKQGWLQRIALVLIAVGLIVVGGSLGNSQASASETDKMQEGALTLPPPEIVPFGIFDPLHLYLENGSNSISPSSGSVFASASTTANQYVDSIGVVIYVQRWTGSAWVTEGSGSTLGGSNLSYYSNGVTKTVTNGYYYRTRSIHWINHGSTYEQGELFSGSVLVV